jgi:hypothetical protein
MFNVQAVMHERRDAAFLRDARTILGDHPAQAPEASAGHSHRHLGQARVAQLTVRCVAVPGVAPITPRARSFATGG